MSWEAIAAFALLGVTVITSLILTMRGLAKIESNLHEYIDGKHESNSVKLMIEVDRSRDMFGESLKAVKQHAEIAHTRVDQIIIRHQDLELYIRDKYMEIKDFDAVMVRLERTIDSMDSKIDKLMARD